MRNNYGKERRLRWGRRIYEKEKDRNDCKKKLGRKSIIWKNRGRERYGNEGDDDRKKEGWGEKSGWESEKRNRIWKICFKILREKSGYEINDRGKNRESFWDREKERKR